MIWIIQLLVLLVIFAIAMQIVRTAPIVDPATRWLLGALVALIFIVVLCGLAGLTGPGCWAPPPFTWHK